MNDRIFPVDIRGLVGVFIIIFERIGFMQNGFRSSNLQSVIRRKKNPLSSSCSDFNFKTNEPQTPASSVLSRSFKDFKKFQDQKKSFKNSFYDVSKTYAEFCWSLQTKLEKTFKSVTLSKCSSSWQELSCSIVFSMGRFEKVNSDSFLKSSLIKTLNVCNDLVEEDEFEIKSIIDHIDLRTSHKTDEVMIVFVIKENISSCKDSKLSKQDEMSLKTLVFRLRDLGSVITCAYYSKNGILTKIVGKDRLRESIAEINLEVKPYTVFTVNPYRTYDILRRFEQLISYGNGEVSWNLNCRYGLFSIAMIRAGYRCFSQIIPSHLDAIKINYSMNKNIISDDILINMDSYISSQSYEDLLISEKLSSPSLILLNLDDTAGDSILRKIILAMSSNKRVSLFVYSTKLSLIEDLSLKLKGYEIDLKQIEGWQLFPNEPECLYLAIYTKRF